MIQGIASPCCSYSPQFQGGKNKILKAVTTPLADQISKPKNTTYNQVRFRTSAVIEKFMEEKIETPLATKIFNIATKFAEKHPKTARFLAGFPTIMKK